MTREEFFESLRSSERIFALLKSQGYEEILEAAAAAAGLTQEEMERYPMGGYGKGMTSGAYRFTLRDLLRNTAQYEWLYNRLEDEGSKRVFGILLAYRVFPSGQFLQVAYDGSCMQYFDKKIVSCGEDEVFVDCGGYIGDTAEAFIGEFGKYRHIYVYEPSQDNIHICRENLSGYPDITVRRCGVGEKHDFLSIRDNADASTFMQGEHTEGEDGIEIVSLDEDIQEKITFLKMDIEGSEIAALLGAKRHIREDFPKLAICLYHVFTDLWEIPRLVDAIRPGYRFFLRHYNAEQNWETVLYAIPPEKTSRQVPALTSCTGTARQKRIAAINAFRKWNNVDLLKDCGAIPYLLHKDHGCEAVMVGSDPEETLTNLRYVEGLKLEVMPGSMPEMDIQQFNSSYLEREGGNIDALILYGMYPNYITLTQLYKEVNPEGRIYLALDVNSLWADRTQWREPEFFQFLERCDVIGVAGHTMQRHLMEKWPWKLNYFPNGFYNFTGRELEPSFACKRDVILTVGRLGTEQKATDVLLEGFAKAAERLPGWELRLAGPVAPEFEPYLEQFRERHPALMERIHFLGPVGDRDALYEEYLHAKVFALPSIWEGWPNVISEALTMGNAIAVSKLDEYQDATDNGRCGMAAEIHDVDGFADVLIRLCTNEKLEQMCAHARAYALENYDMEKIVAKIHSKLFEGEG